MYIRQRDLTAVSRLWCELAEFPAWQSANALTYCLERLTHIVGASNAAWLVATREAGADSADPMRGWWPRDIRMLHDAEEYARRNDAVLSQFKVQVVDPQSAAMVEQAGRTRVQLRAAVIDAAAWRRSWLYRDILRPLHVEDRLVGAHAVTPRAESYFALDRARSDQPFDDRARDVLALFLSGCRTFHREQLLVRGLLDASGKLSPREQGVLRLLLSGRSEAEIADALGLTFNTTHQYVMSVYRKFGVQGRAALMARWLRDRRAANEPSHPTGEGPCAPATG